VTLILLGLSYYTIRVSTDTVDYSTEGCGHIDALVWNGITKYCYDCVEIDGCGFCGGVCTEGKESGPFDLSVCTSTSSWVYDSCESQYEWLPVYSSILYLFVYGLFLTTVNAVVGEIFPLEYRSSAVGICWSLNWILNGVFSFTALTITSPAVLTIYGMSHFVLARD